eukprot:Sspe_Gene.71474::Locus_42385_Transcript_1_1_Confidence_1.000_Length_613::g.71474::m.71474
MEKGWVWDAWAGSEIRPITAAPRQLEPVRKTKLRSVTPPGGRWPSTAPPLAGAPVGAIRRGQTSSLLKSSGSRKEPLTARVNANTISPRPTKVPATARPASQRTAVEALAERERALLQRHREIEAMKAELLKKQQQVDGKEDVKVKRRQVVLHSSLRASSSASQAAQRDQLQSPPSTSLTKANHPPPPPSPPP